MKSTRILSCFLICLGLAGLPSAALSAELPVKKLEADIQKALADFQVPGLAIGIVKEGVPVYTKGFGLKTVNGREPVDENTVFGLGSASKTFNAGLAAVLVQAGSIKWDDKVVRHLPGFRLYDEWVTKETTVRDLLSHRTGVGEADNLGLLFIGSRFSREDVVAKAKVLPPLVEFRTGWCYSNIMYIAAGQMMAGVSGQSWDECLREKIFVPLGMNSSSTGIRAFGPGDNLATPHWYVDGHPTPIPWGNMDTAGPAGAVNSSAADLVKWLQVHLNGGSLAGATLWGPDIQEEIFSPHSLLVNIPIGWKTSFSTYGLGWFICEYRGRKVVWHGGNCDGMSCVIGMLPEKKIGVVILQNTFPTRFEYDLMLRIMDMETGLPETEWRPLGEAQPISMAIKKYVPGPDDGPIDRAAFGKYLGSYSSDLFGECEVRFEGDRAVLRFGGFPSAELRARGENVFIADFGEGASGMFGLLLGQRTWEEVKFSLAEDGAVRDMTVDRFGVFKKK
ncbi:MAG: serine hydrolase [Candidatus Aminicenantes bacterium]|nr:serine hydrolase [Candidatus Aminicenantes bacterium]